MFAWVRSHRLFGLSYITLDGKMFCFTSDATIRQLLEVLPNMDDRNPEMTSDIFNRCSKLKGMGKEFGRQEGRR
jgi:hypothetical protein